MTTNEISTARGTLGAKPKPPKIAGQCNTWDGRNTEHLGATILVNIDGIWGYVCVKHAGALAGMIVAAMNEITLAQEPTMPPSEALRRILDDPSTN